MIFRNICYKNTSDWRVWHGKESFAIPWQITEFLQFSVRSWRHWFFRTEINLTRTDVYASAVGEAIAHCCSQDTLCKPLISTRGCRKFNRSEEVALPSASCPKPPIDGNFWSQFANCTQSHNNSTRDLYVCSSAPFLTYNFKCCVKWTPCVEIISFGLWAISVSTGYKHLLS